MKKATFIHFISKNRIEIKDQIGNWVVLTLDQFLRFEPTYSVPSNIALIRYVKGEKHTMVSSGPVATTFYLGNDWPDGNRYIQRLGEFKNLVLVEQQEQAEAAKLAKEVKEEKKLIPEKPVLPLNTTTVKKKRKKKLDAGPNKQN